MADNYVSIKIKADDTAKPDLTELKADLDELGRKVDTAKVDVNDEDAKLKLLEINAKLAALDRRVVNPRINTASAARAESDIAKLGADMDKLEQKAQQNSSNGGLLGRILFGSGGGSSGGGGGGLLGSFGSLPSMGGGIGGILSNPYGLGAIAAGAQAALVEVTGLASGFAAAAAGAGAFALLAKPALTSVTGAYTQLNTAMTKYQAAQAKEAMSPSKANAAAVKAALLNVNLAGQAIDKLPASERKAVDGLEQLSTSFHKLSKAFEPEAFKVFADGLSIANHLLPTITPFATAFANALDGLLKKADKFTQSTGFKDWLAQFQKLTGPSTTAIGEGIGKVAISLGKLLTIMSAKDVVNSINIAFTVLAGTITVVGAVVRGAMFQWDMLTSAFRSVRHDTAALAHDIAHYFDLIRHAISGAVDSVVSFVRSHWKLLIAAILGPLGLIVDAVTTHWHAVQKVTAAAWDYVSWVVGRGVSRVKGVLDWFGGLAGMFLRWWNGAGNATSGGISRLIGFVQSIPGRVNSALAGLPGMMLRAGVNAINSLISGIASGIGSLGSLMGSIASKVAGFFGLSPAKEGPLSGGGSPHIRGQHFAADIAAGMMSGQSVIASAARQLAGTAGISPAGRTGGGGGGQIVIHISPGGGSGLDALFWTWLKSGVRVQGGDPAMFQRKVTFA